MSAGKIITSVVIGAAAGAILGVLFAPDKGSETRKKISEKGTDFTDQLKDKFNDFVDNVADKFGTAKDQAADMVDKGKQKAEQWKGDARNAMS